MSLQACLRCRKRKLKCDTRLPSCAKCSSADVECLLYDESLEQKIPRSYIYSLQQNVDRLQNEIRILKGRSEASLHGKPAQVPGSYQVKPEYHINIEGVKSDSNLSRTSFLGPGSTARLMERLMKQTAEWLIQIENSSPILSTLSKNIEYTSQISIFSLNIDHRKLDISSFIPPSTQRSLIRHYLKVVQTQYPLLSAEQEEFLIEQEAPLRYNSKQIGQMDRLAITAIFAISTALVARDIDSNMSGVVNYYDELLQRNAEQTFSHASRTTCSSGTVIALCFLAIKELVCPTNHQVWELVGRALASMEQYQNCCSPSVLDTEYTRLKLCLAKLESSLALHFRRPSSFWPETEIRNMIDQDPASPVVIDTCILRISDALSLQPQPPYEHLEQLIPLQLRVARNAVSISLPSARIYLALHPLFTDRLYDLFSDQMAEQDKVDLWKIVATSASVVIESYVRLQKEQRLLSVWLAAERVLEAAAVSAIYFLVTRRTHVGSAEAAYNSLDESTLPLWKCANLLTSYAERWKEAIAYSRIWDTFLSLLSGVLER